jgi:glyoxylase-like metal-dependent hydrolase (beta-lactamase superfamily II)
MRNIFALCLILSFSLFGTAHAAAPQLKKPAPGFYRFMVGDIEVTALLDGTFPMKPGDILQGVKPEEVTKFLNQAYEGPTVMTSVNGFLVNTGTKLVLIDTGTGGFMGPTVGHLLENLKASGYQPEQIDEVYLTHMHGDHLGGLANSGKKNFPNAVVRADVRDANYWLSDVEAAKVTNPMMKGNFEHAKTSLAPYQTNGQFKPFDGETELVPGIHAHPAYGHTPGHTVYTVESKGKKLWLIGDMIHVAAVQFPKPTATLKFDSDNKLAASERAKDFAMAAKDGDLIGAAHLSYPGVGHIKKAGSGYTYTPIAYGWLGE